MKKVIAYGVVAVLIMFLVEQVLQLPYLMKTLIKIPVFTCYPFLVLRKEKFKINKHSFKQVVILSIVVLITILLAYVILQDFIDVESIKTDLESRMSIGRSMFFFAAFYTIFINAFIEEYFFRGYLFRLIHKEEKRLAYVFAALLFAVYHIGILGTWFSLPILSLVLIGLFIGGLIFNYYVSKTNSFLASYIIHVAADIAVVIIGVCIIY